MIRADFRSWLRSLFAALVDPPNIDKMAEYQAWRDSRPDGLLDQAHRDPSARARGDVINGSYTVGPPVSRPLEPAEEAYGIRYASPTVHYHTDDPGRACFSRHDAPPIPDDWLKQHWPKDTPDGTL